MDPNENLMQQRKIAESIIDNDNGGSNADEIRLAELVLAMHEWISNGGFLPADWARS